MPKILRPYQEAAVKSIWHSLENFPEDNVLINAPVAAGKTIIISEFIKQVHTLFPRTRIIVLAHVKELLEQNAKELLEHYPNADFGFYCAGLGKKRINNDITFASIQSIVNKTAIFNRVPELIIVDEVHLVPEDEDTQYRKFINAVHNVNPNAKIIGLTGTIFRQDSGRLDEGDKRIFNRVAYDITIPYMIEEGYWAKPVTPPVDFKMSGEGIGVNGGEYVASQIADKYNNQDVNTRCAQIVKEKAAGRRRGLVFCATIQHANDVAAALNAVGVSARALTSENTSEENNEILAAHKRGEFEALVNVAKLTTGYNDPLIDYVVYWRPIRSPVLYIQTIGRGVRSVYADGFDLSTKEGRLEAIANSVKPDCLVLDFGGVIDELGPIDQVSIKKRFTGEKQEGDTSKAPATKICPNCAEVCAAAQRYCYACSYSFIASQLGDSASSAAIVSSDEPPVWYEVLGWAMGKHLKKGHEETAPPTMKVAYTTLGGQFREFVCFEHTGYALDKARHWFKEHALPPYSGITPEYVDDALAIPLEYYKKPERILVKRNGKYWNITEKDYTALERQLEPEQEDEIQW